MRAIVPLDTASLVPSGPILFPLASDPDIMPALASRLPNLEVPRILGDVLLLHHVPLSQK